MANKAEAEDDFDDILELVVPHPQIVTVIPPDGSILASSQLLLIPLQLAPRVLKMRPNLKTTAT